MQDRIKRLEAENAHLKESQSKIQTWEDLYGVVSENKCTDFNMKSFKENQHRTFTEMFDEMGGKLQEKRSFEQMYETANNGQMYETDSLRENSDEPEDNEHLTEESEYLVEDEKLIEQEILKEAESFQKEVLNESE